MRTQGFIGWTDKNFQELADGRGKGLAMEVTERFQEDALILLVSGRVSYYSRKVFQAIIKNAGISGVHRIIVNLSGVTWMDSAGLSLLALAHLECERRQVTMSVVGPRSPVREMLEQANLFQLIPVFATEEQALGRTDLAQA